MWLTRFLKKDYSVKIFQVLLFQFKFKKKISHSKPDYFQFKKQLWISDFLIYTGHNNFCCLLSGRLFANSLSKHFPKLNIFPQINYFHYIKLVHFLSFLSILEFLPYNLFICNKLLYFLLILLNLLFQNFIS